MRELALVEQMGVGEVVHAKFLVCGSHHLRTKMVIPQHSTLTMLVSHRKVKKDRSARGNETKSGSE